MEKINLLNETVIAIFLKNDFKNPAIRLFGNTIFSENEKLEKLKKIFNSELKNNIVQVIIGQVNNDIDIYTLYNNKIFKEGNWSQALINLPIDNNIEKYLDSVLNDVNNLLKENFNKNDFDSEIDYSENEIIVRFSEEIFDVYDLNYSEKENFKNKINNIPYYFNIYDDYSLMLRIKIPQPCNSNYKEYKL